MTETDKMFFRTLGLKIIPAYFYSQNPEKVMLWQFNACSQTSMIIDFFLKLKNFDSEIWTGNFKSSDFGEYNHSWNYITNKNIIVDVSSVYSIIEWSSSSDPSIFKPDTVKLNSKKLNLDYFDDIEYYTQKTKAEILKDILAIVSKSKFKL